MLTQPYAFASARIGLGYLRDGPPALIDDERSRDPVPKSISKPVSRKRKTTAAKYFRPGSRKEHSVAAFTRNRTMSYFAIDSQKQSTLGCPIAVYKIGKSSLMARSIRDWESEPTVG